MWSIEHQAYSMLVCLLANSILVSSRPAHVQDYFFKRIPDTYAVKFPTDEGTSAIIIDENGDYHLIRDHKQQEQYPGYPKGEGNVCGRIEDVSNHADIPILYDDDDSENRFMTTVDSIDTNTDYGETREPSNPDDSTGKAEILSPNPAKTIGRVEQKMHDYFAKLLKTTSPQPLDDVSNRTMYESPLALEVDGNGTSTVTKEPSEDVLLSSTTTTKITQGTKEEGDEKQPNTLLFADSFEKSNSAISEDLHWGMPILDTESTTKNSATASNSVVDEIMLTPHKNARIETTKSGNQTESSPVESVTSFELHTLKPYPNRNVSNETKPAPSNTWLNIIQNSSQNGTLGHLGAQKSPEKPHRNLVSSFTSSWELDAKKLAPSRIPPSENEEAQNQIISNIISSILRGMIARSRSYHVRRRRENSSRSSSKYHYSILPSGDKNVSKDDHTQMHSRKKVIVVPARLIFKKSQRGSKGFEESGAEVRRREFEKQMEIFNRLFSGGSKNRKSYREDFEQIM